MGSFFLENFKLHIIWRGGSQIRSLMLVFLLLFSTYKSSDKRVKEFMQSFHRHFVQIVHKMYFHLILHSTERHTSKHEHTLIIYGVGLTVNAEGTCSLNVSKYFQAKLKKADEFTIDKAAPKSGDSFFKAAT
jgi:hypothetical protein